MPTTYTLYVNGKLCSTLNNTECPLRASDETLIIIIFLIEDAKISKGPLISFTRVKYVWRLDQRSITAEVGLGDDRIVPCSSEDAVLLW